MEADIFNKFEEQDSRMAHLEAKLEVVDEKIGMVLSEVTQIRLSSKDSLWPKVAAGAVIVQAVLGGLVDPAHAKEMVMTILGGH